MSGNTPDEEGNNIHDAVERENARNEDTFKNQSKKEN